MGFTPGFESISKSIFGIDSLFGYSFGSSTPQPPAARPAPTFEELKQQTLPVREATPESDEEASKEEQSQPKPKSKKPSPHSAALFTHHQQSAEPIEASEPVKKSKKRKRGSEVAVFQDHETQTTLPRHGKK